MWTTNAHKTKSQNNAVCGSECSWLIARTIAHTTAQCPNFDRMIFYIVWKTEANQINCKNTFVKWLRTRVLRHTLNSDTSILFAICFYWMCRVWKCNQLLNFYFWFCKFFTFHLFWIFVVFPFEFNQRLNWSYDASGEIRCHWIIIICNTTKWKPF